MSESPKLQAILDRLEKVRKAQKGYIARCPAHDDGSPSLQITEGNDWINLHCYAGCSYQSVIDALKVGWDDVRLKDDDGWQPKVNGRRPSFDRRGSALEAAMCAEALQADTDLLARLRRERGWAKEALRLLGVGTTGKPKHPITLPVWDKDGLFHDVLRYDPFLRQGRKILAGDGRTRQPWPAPERLVPNGRELFIVEGEGTALSLHSIGLNAVGLPGSVSRGSGNISRPGSFAGGGWHPKWAERFKGFRCVCMPDADEAGRALIHTVNYDLERVGVKTAILDLRASRKGFDVGDMLAPANTLGLRREARTLLMEAVYAVKHKPSDLDSRLDALRDWYGKNSVKV